MTTTATTTMSQPLSPGPKKAPHKKRHTKPCRYFQVGRCPHGEQEDCDFAHVYSDAPSYHAPKQCRYYLQGICTNGIWCQYRHGEGSTEDRPLVEDYRNGMRREFNASPAVVPAQVYIPNTPFSGMYAPPTPWSPYAEAFHSPHIEFAPPSSYYLAPTAGSPAASLDYASSPASSVSDDAPDDSHYAYTSPSYSYFPADAAYLGAPSPSADDAQFAPRALVPTPYGMASLYEVFSPKSASFNYQPEPRSAPVQVNRVKPASYRTKPCRYFKAGSVCPNGDACTFIHANPAPESENESSPSPLASPVKLQYELPSKPLSAKEENTRKGYFPISWRVIGGGVLVGGTKALSDDADSDLSTSDDAESFDRRVDPVSRVLEIDIPASAPPKAVEFPYANTEPDAYDSITPTGFPARPRALSIPSTPNTVHFDVLRLFSAESPGGL